MYSPVNGGSVPRSRSTWNWAGVSRRRHSSSLSSRRSTPAIGGRLAPRSRPATRAAGPGGERRLEEALADPLQREAGEVVTRVVQLAGEPLQRRDRVEGRLARQRARRGRDRRLEPVLLGTDPRPERRAREAGDGAETGEELRRDRSLDEGIDEADGPGRGRVEQGRAARPSAPWRPHGARVPGPPTAAATVASHERPGVRALAAGGRREGTELEEGACAARERLGLLGAEEAGDGLRHAARERLAAGEELARQRLAGEVPHHGAQLGLRVEAQAVVDGVDPSGPVDEQVAALAVGVVGEEVEAGDATKRRVVPLVLEQREVVLLEVRLDEALERSLAERPVAPQHRLGDDAETEGLGELVGGDLPAVQAGGEVPQAALAARRLVHGPTEPIPPDRDEEGGVRAPGHPADELEGAAPQQRQPLRRAQVSGGRWPFVLGHAWPLGSSGKPHSGHGGRPASTRRTPSIARAPACSRVRARRASAPSSSSPTSSSARTTMRSSRAS